MLQVTEGDAQQQYKIWFGQSYHLSFLSDDRMRPELTQFEMEFLPRTIRPNGRSRPMLA